MLWYLALLMVSYRLRALSTQLLHRLVPLVLHYLSLFEVCDLFHLSAKRCFSEPFHI